ncbi:unnamed protein product [Paramecium sonneborni]|uniref:RBR-type E3 ubiquitin transferase n=1 Tax=Paramecium sonneborni TaxID=65129 RepID=A0A8S1R3P1_9CILI|nr:unnamed protein product [Paramecium sonneborni]
MSQISDINLEEILQPQSINEQQLQNEKQNTIVDKQNEVDHEPDQCDHIAIQMQNQDQDEEKIKQDQTYQEDIKESQFEHNNNIDSTSNKDLKMVAVLDNQYTKRQDSQEAIDNKDVKIEIINQANNNSPKGQDQEMKVELIYFEENEDNNNNANGKINYYEEQQQQQQSEISRKSSVNMQIQEVSIEQKDEDIKCPICNSSFEEIVRLLQCEHQFCKSCYKEYLEDKIKIAKINNIPCLQAGCTNTFTEEIIKDNVSDQKFKQYLVFKRKLEIENDPNKKWCPGKNCDLFIEKDPKINLIQCQCGLLVCFNCGQIAHQGMLCEDAIQGDFKQALVKYLIKYCPKCKSHIQKNAGCNHMTCIQCQFQFCWVCLQQYHEYHYRYWSIKGCAIWSNGRFKTSKVIENPDQMRKIYFVPRLFLYFLRGPLLIVKLTLKAAGKSIVKPLVGLNKKICRLNKPKFCLLKCIYFLLAELLILLIVILVFPFYFVFYRLGKEMQWLSIKGCAY